MAREFKRDPRISAIKLGPLAHFIALEIHGGVGHRPQLDHLHGGAVI